MSTKRHEEQLSNELKEELKKQGLTIWRCARHENVNMYGYPDLEVWHKKSHFYIEMKQTKGRISDDQVIFARDVYEKGKRCVFFTFGLDVALRLCEEINNNSFNEVVKKYKVTDKKDKHYGLLIVK